MINSNSSEHVGYLSYQTKSITNAYKIFVTYSNPILRITFFTSNRFFSPFPLLDVGNSISSSSTSIADAITLTTFCKQHHELRTDYATDHPQRLYKRTTEIHCRPVSTVPTTDYSSTYQLCAVKGPTTPSEKKFLSFSILPPRIAAFIFRGCHHGEQLDGLHIDSCSGRSDIAQSIK